MPAGDKVIGVDAREEARKVLVVDMRCRSGVKVTLLQKLNKFKNITFGQVVWESRWKELINELGDAVQHGSEWSGEEADDWMVVRKRWEEHDPCPATKDMIS